MKVNIFPLPKLILNPGGKLTLNLFEKRYLNLLNDCINNQTPMAIAHAQECANEWTFNIPDQCHPFIFEEVTYGTPKILTETSTGSFIIVVEGIGKGRITQAHLLAKGFIEAHIEPVEQIENLRDDNQFLYRRLKGLTREKVYSLLKNERETRVLMENLRSPQEVIAFYSDHLVKSFETRFEIFQQNNINHKLELLADYWVA